MLRRSLCTRGGLLRGNLAAQHPALRRTEAGLVASSWLLGQVRHQSLAGNSIRVPFTEGVAKEGATVDGNRRRFNPSTVGHQVKNRVQQDRMDHSLPEVVSWDDFAEGAVCIPTRSGPLWVGADDPRCERYMKRKTKMEKNPLQMARKQPKTDIAKELETHPLREYFSTPSDLNNPITIADGLAKAGLIKAHEVKHMATQLKWEPRPPHVSIMGHVDHGKTTLLDYLRNTNVAAGEAGGITQSIGAFRVNVAKVLRRERGEPEPEPVATPAITAAKTAAAQPRAAGGGSVLAAKENADGPLVQKKSPTAGIDAPLMKDEVSDFITFIDTPGHAAFKEMRESGAAATDLALLIVSVTDGVQPQTEESVAILMERKVPFIVVFNKIDRDENVAPHMDKLRDVGVEFEEDGGDTMWIGVSALHGTNIPELLEMIQLQTSMLELATPTPARAEILVIDSHNKHKTKVAGIVRTGVAKHGQTLASGTTYATVKKLFDETGEKEIRRASVGEPVLLEGFKVLPKPGVVLFQLQSDTFGDRYHHLMKEVYQAEGSRESYLQTLNAERMGRIYDRKPDNNEKAVYDATPFNLSVKASSFGQLQAVMRLLYELPPLEGVQLVIRGGEVGGITDYDVLGLMGKQQPGGVLVFGDIRNANRLDLPEFIEVYSCQVVYHGIDWVKEKLVSMMPKQYNERVVAEARVKQTFRASQAGKGNAAGLDVQQGTLVVTESFRVMRPVPKKKSDEVPEMLKVYEGEAKELRRFKEQVKSVEEGLECGVIMNEDFTFRVGDIVQQVVKDIIERDVDEEIRKALELERVNRARMEADDAQSKAAEGEDAASGAA